jgi:ribosomal-protein-alanine N-acetyltransferase
MDQQMRYLVNQMTLADIPRVVEIEKLAYPSTWPASSYRKELQDNPLAHYIVERDTKMPIEAGGDSPSDSGRRPFPLSLLARPSAPLPPEIANIVGFAGLWLMVDEAHVTTIATHPDYRHRGLGELLLTALIDIAYDIGARQVTLEARVSNTIAQNLYRKYGFREAGIRRRYYSDNQEDALIMWTDDIMSNHYREQYFFLTQRLAARLAAEENSVDSAGGTTQPA